MKNLFLLLIVLVTISCSENITDSSSAIQGFIDNELYRANGVIAMQDGDGGYIIEGSTGTQTLTMRISGGQETTYNLGSSSTNYATFNDGSPDEYTTIDPNGNGSITVTSLKLGAGTISGSFRFKAIKQGVDTIRVRNGIFFEVPFVPNSEVIVDPEDPEEPPMGPCNAGTFVSLIDGDPLQQGNNLCVQAVVFQEQIVITASDPDDEIQLRMPLSIGAGQNVLPKEGITGTYKDVTTGVIETLNLGNLVILSHNTQANLIRGSFSFETPNHEITIGSFNVTYQ